MLHKDYDRKHSVTEKKKEEKTLVVNLKRLGTKTLTLILNNGVRVCEEFAGE
jgi:hypothetical protein